MTTEPPHITALSSVAIFLDIDGTLAEIAPSPHLATIDATTLSTVKSLHRACNGALAFVSGRHLADIDRLTGLPDIAAAGIHGAQMRLGSGTISQLDTLSDEIAKVEQNLRRECPPHFGVEIERKPLSVAVHFRGNPDVEDIVKAAARRVLSQTSNIKMISGKKIVELLPSGVDKGIAITRFMQHPPFLGRHPLFAGDDETDEDAFKVVNAAGGTAIKIGPEPTCAPCRFLTPSAFRHWLSSLIDHNSSQS